MAIFEITLLFLGSIIGAGFATGAEIVTFFGHAHLPVWCTAIIVGLAMFTIITLEIYLHYPKPKQITISNNIATTHKITLSNKKSTFLLDIVFVMIYQILFTAMTAGITQITNTNFCIISLIASIVVILFNFKHLSHLNTYIVLIIIILIISTTLPHLKNINHTPYNFKHITFVIYWALLYAGLNCFIFPEIIKASSINHPRRILFLAGALTAFLVAILFGLILTVIHNTNTASEPIPLLSAAPHTTTTVIILLAIFTSQYSALFAISHRIQKLLPRTQKKPLLVALFISILAFLGSFCGFTHIIQFGYPVIGTFTCFYLLISFLKKFLNFLQHHSSQ